MALTDEQKQFLGGLGNPGDYSSYSSGGVDYVVRNTGGGQQKVGTIQDIMANGLPSINQSSNSNTGLTPINADFFNQMGYSSSDLNSELSQIEQNRLRREEALKIQGQEELGRIQRSGESALGGQRFSNAISGGTGTSGLGADTAKGGTMALMQEGINRNIKETQSRIDRALLENDTQAYEQAKAERQTFRDNLFQLQQLQFNQQLATLQEGRAQTAETRTGITFNQEQQDRIIGQANDKLSFYLDNFGVDYLENNKDEIAGLFKDAGFEDADINTMIDVYKKQAEAAAAANLPKPELRTVDGSLYSVVLDEATGQYKTELLIAKKAGEGDTVTDPEEKRFYTEAQSLKDKLDSGDITWARAFDSLKTSYPTLSNEAIDAVLGGSIPYVDGQFLTDQAKGRANNVTS